MDSSEANPLLRSPRIVRVPLPTATHMDKKKKWLRRWKNWVAATRVPGVWERKEGGHLVRTRIMDPATGRKREIKKVLPEADDATAYKWLADEKARIRAGIVLAQPQKQR